MDELINQTPTGEDLSIVAIRKPLADCSADDLLESMSQVSLKEETIKELQAESEKVKAELAKINESRTQLLQDKSQLQQKVEELKEKCIGKGPL